MTWTPERWARLSPLLDELLDLEAGARARRLREIAGEDATLATELRVLLAEDARASGVLDHGVAALAPTVVDALGGGTTQAAQAPDSRIGSYRILRLLGRGGMGEVYLAQRSEAGFEQQVALKLLKRGMESDEILRRFTQERRILAQLSHPHIARFLDGGVSADARPYFAMEFVDGKTLTDFAHARALGLRDRVSLLASVCDAVAYAHSRLVVHRDLKPSNILVDANGQPRVLDFGIAKLLGDDVDAQATATGMRAMSPAYAAPEQILGEPVGTATDVYALGVIAFELFTGHLPHQRSGGVEALQRELAQESTLRPSRVLRQAGATSSGRLDAARSAREMAGDLDTIVLTALQREPQRRYAIAAALADDLRRWLAGRPIAARPDTARYRMAKFVRRHRVGVAASTLVLAALVAGLGIALWQARIAREQAARADAERANAQRQLARTERVKEYVLALFREQDPISRAKAKARTAAQLIGDGVAQIDATLGAEPDLQAELLRDLGEIQINLDDGKAGVATLARAWELQKRQSGADSLAATETLVVYANGVYAAGDVKTAKPLVDAAIKRLRELGAERGERMAQAESLAARLALIAGENDAAQKLARDAVDITRALHGPRGIEVVDRLGTLGNVLHESAHFPEALATFREAIGIVEQAGGADNARAAMLHTYAGDTLRVLRKYEQALPEYETALAIERAQLPADHAILGGTLLRLGDLQRRTGRFDAADASLTEAIRILAKTPSGHHAQALQFYANLARAQGRPDLAAQRYHASVAAFRAVTGDSVYTWLTALEEVGALVELGRLDEADALAAQAVAVLGKLSKDDSYEAAYVNSVVGKLRHAQRRLPEAIAARRRTVALIEKAYGPDHAEVALARTDLAESLVATRDAASRREAATLLDQARTTLERGGEETAEPMLGAVHLVRGRVRRADGDLAGARADAAQAIARLQAPEYATRLREATRLAQELGAGP
jgi:serine/threonine-protein kinase